MRYPKPPLSTLKLCLHTLELKLPFELVAAIQNFQRAEYCHFYSKDGQDQRRSIIGRHDDDEYFTLSIMGETEYTRVDDTIQCHIQDCVCLSVQQPPATAPGGQDSATAACTPTKTATSSVYHTPQSAEVHPSLTPCTSPNPRKSSRIQNKYGEGHSLVKKLKLAPNSRNVEKPESMRRKRYVDVYDEVTPQVHVEYTDPETELLSADTVETLEAILALKGEAEGLGTFSSPQKRPVTEAVLTHPVEQVDTTAELYAISRTEETPSFQNYSRKCGRTDTRDESDRDNYQDDTDRDPDWEFEQPAVVKTMPKGGRKRSKSAKARKNGQHSGEASDSPFTLSVTQLLEGTQRDNMDLDYTNPPVYEQSNKLCQSAPSTSAPDGYIPPQPGETMVQWKARNPHHVYRCLQCDCYRSQERSTFKSHLVNAHRMTMTAYQKSHGLNVIDLYSPHVEKREHKKKEKMSKKKPKKTSGPVEGDAMEDSGAASTFLCELCGLPFKKKHALVLHLKGTHVKDPRSRECLEALSRLAWALVHKSFQCPYCTSEHKGAEILSHLGATHRGQADFSATVQSMKRSLTAEQTRQHKRLAQNQHQVQENISSHTAVKDAIRWKQRGSSYKSGVDSSGQRLYSCPSCDFISESLLKMKLHIHATHENHRKFMCDECAASYNTRLALEQHVKSRHLTKKKGRACPATLRTCPHCGEEFLLRSLLTTHLHTHDEKNPEPAEAEASKEGPHPQTPPPQTPPPDTESGDQSDSEQPGANSVQYIVESSQDNKVRGKVESPVVDLTVNSPPSQTDIEVISKDDIVEKEAPPVEEMDSSETLSAYSVTEELMDSSDSLGSPQETSVREHTLDCSDIHASECKEAVDNDVDGDPINDDPLTNNPSIVPSSNEMDSPVNKTASPEHTVDSSKTQSSDPVEKAPDTFSQSITNVKDSPLETNKMDSSVKSDADVKDTSLGEDNVESSKENSVKNNERTPDSSSDPGTDPALAASDPETLDTGGSMFDQCNHGNSGVPDDVDTMSDFEDSIGANVDRNERSFPGPLLDHMAYIRMPDSP